MKTKKNKIVGIVLFVSLFVVWGVVFCAFRSSAFTVFPGQGFELYAVTDKDAGGFSTSELSYADSAAVAHVNVHSGRAFPYAGIGVNLMSVNNRPVGHFDLSKFDSISVLATAGRMKSITLRVLTDDPVYSSRGSYLSYRPLEAKVPVSNSYSELKVSLADFKNAEWWLVAQGLDKDDGLSFFFRTTLLEIVNGEGALRGIPDDIEVKRIDLWGENRNFEKGMFFAGVFLVIAFVAFLYRTFRRPKNGDDLKKRMGKAASLLKNTDKSVAEIAIEVGEKSPSQFEHDFMRIYKVKPLSYRKKNV